MRAATPIAAALLVLAGAAAPTAEAGCAETNSDATPPRRVAHAVLSFRGDLDTTHAADALAEQLGELCDEQPALVLIELDGNASRPDLLDKTLRAFLDAEVPLAVFLGDTADRTVGPGMLALALAADHAAVAPGTTIRRTPEDDRTRLHPEVEDWAVIGLDLRARAGSIAAARGLPEPWVEALVAPRADAWLAENADGRAVLVEESAAGTEPVVSRAVEGWSFELASPDAVRVYGLGSSRTSRLFARELGHRARPSDEVEIVSDLAATHERCLLLVDRVRTAIDLADAALDVYGNRRGRESLLPRDYHAAADRADTLVTECRAAIEEIESHTARLPELLQMEPPDDTRTPTEIGGPARTRLSAWRDAVRDAEYALSNLDERIADYRRR